MVCAIVASQPLGMADQGGATITGRVVFSGTVPPPMAVPVTRDSQVCGSSVTDDPLVVNRETRGVHNAVISVEVSQAPPAAAQQATTTIQNKQCRFVPRIGAFQTGNPLEVTNDDPIMHNTHVYNDERTVLNVALPAGGRPIIKQTKKAGLYRVQCDAHKFMHAYRIGFDHPFFDVSDERGEFRIVNVPSGHRRLQVWHESLGNLSREIDVPPTGEITITLEYPRR